MAEPRIATTCLTYYTDEAWLERWQTHGIYHSYVTSRWNFSNETTLQDILQDMLQAVISAQQPTANRGIARVTMTPYVASSNNHHHRRRRGLHRRNYDGHRYEGRRPHHYAPDRGT